MGSTTATVRLNTDPEMSLKMLSVLMLVVVESSLVMGGFRCTLGEWACSASCVTLGQTSGICDSERECNLGEKFCEGTCQATGRVGGKCTVDEDGAKDCQCNETFLSASQFALCAAESTCRLDCQRQGHATGD